MSVSRRFLPLLPSTIIGGEDIRSRELERVERMKGRSKQSRDSEKHYYFFPIIIGKTNMMSFQTLPVWAFFWLLS